MPRTSICLLLVAVLFTPAQASPAAASGDPPAIEALAWLAGCWSSQGEGQLTEECWLHPAGGMMLGLNRTVSGETTAFEFLRIAASGDGLAYFASPGGRQPTPFALVEQAEGRAVFANPEHDFPQRLTYHLAADGTLTVAVEARRDGEWHGFKLRWQRSALAPGGGGQR